MTELPGESPASPHSHAGRNAFLVLAAAWLAAIAVLAVGGRSVEEPIALLVIFGLALPGLALLVCRGLPKLPAPQRVARDGTLIAALVLLIAAYLAFKAPIFTALFGQMSDPRWSSVVNSLLKLVFFVAVPLATYAIWGGLSPRGLGLTWPPGGSSGRSLLAFLAIGGALTAIQLTMGHGARPLMDGTLAHRHWVLGLLFCFLWMSVEAGVVEETFFRVILQSRLAAITRSQAAGIFLSALLFGLAHAPGLWLRGAGAIEGLGAAPSLPVAAAYSVATMALAGIVFGVLWMRTRNWLLLIALHGLGDALSNTASFMGTWGG